jgi:hypothetical protein
MDTHEYYSRIDNQKYMNQLTDLPVVVTMPQCLYEGYNQIL